MKGSEFRNTPIRIVIGSGGVLTRNWILTDKKTLDLLIPEHWESNFYKDSIDALMAEHVWEHLNIEDGLRAAQQCYCYLKPGGYVRIAVPDGFHPDPDYIDWVKINGKAPDADDHKVLYTHEILSQMLEKAGFKVELLEYFDAKGRFHYSNWDPEAGLIRRSRRFDERNKNGELKYTSLIVDARK